MNPISTDFGITYPVKHLPVILDGKLLGGVDPKMAHIMVNQLRALKCRKGKTSKDEELYTCVPKTLEIAFLPPTVKEETSSNESTNSSSDSTDIKEKFFPGIFFSSQPARFVRPVQNLEHGGIEFIGPLEQVNLSIAVQEEDLRKDSTHQELDPINMLSVIASTIPFADYN